MEIEKEKEGDEVAPKQRQEEKPIKGKSCKGCLYYSSTLKSKPRNPLCLGLTRSVLVRGYLVGESEMEASKEGRNLSDFKYGCLGYSVYLDGKDSSTEMQETKAELPVCVGIEDSSLVATTTGYYLCQLLVDRKAPASADAPDHVSAPLHNKEDGRVLPPPPRPQKPAHAGGVEFLNRFTRNAGLVASGVTKNMIRVGNYVKGSLEDILYPYRRRPK